MNTQRRDVVGGKCLDEDKNITSPPVSVFFFWQLRGEVMPAARFIFLNKWRQKSNAGHKINDSHLNFPCFCLCVNITVMQMWWCVVFERRCSGDTLLIFVRYFIWNRRWWNGFHSRLSTASCVLALLWQRPACYGMYKCERCYLFLLLIF